jgi:hypothetical protein
MAITNSSVASTTTTQIFLAANQQAVTTMIFCNISASTAATLNVYVVPYGSNANTNTQILNFIPIPATETFMFDTEKLILENGDAIYAQADVPGTIVATISSITTA